MTIAEGSSSPGTPRRQLLIIGPTEGQWWSGLAAIADQAEILAITEDEETLLRHVGTAEIVYIWGNTPILETLWPQAHSLRWVHAAWAGVDRLLIPALVESDVVLTRTPGVYGNALAEYAMAAVLHFAKRIPELQAYQRQRAWQRITPLAISGATLGVVGLGDVGRTVATKAKALDMRVIGLSRGGGTAPACVDRLLPVTALDELLAACDFVVVTTPLTPQTRGLLGSRELGLIKPGAVLINIARGGIVDEEALLSALQSGRLGGAAVDVFAQEPLPADSPLWDAPNLLISAHTVDNVVGSKERALDLFVDSFRRYVAGQPLPHVVDKRRGY